MKEREAIDWVKDLKLSEEIREFYYAESFIKALDMAIQALEKQIAKKPTYEGDGYAPDGTFVFDTWVCPRCGRSYELDYDDCDFCPNCGQNLDWSD